MATFIVLRVPAGWFVLACLLGPILGRRMRRVNSALTDHNDVRGGTR